MRMVGIGILLQGKATSPRSEDQAQSIIDDPVLLEDKKMEREDKRPIWNLI